jgi:ketosteroid isomerase-like protein
VPAERVAVTRRIVERLAADDAQGPAELLHPRFELCSPLASLDAKSYLDHDAEREHLAVIGDASEEVRFELDERHDATEQTLAVVDLLGRARAGGVPPDQTRSQVWTWRAGEACGNVAYLDASQAREASAA